MVPALVAWPQAVGAAQAACSWGLVHVLLVLVAGAASAGLCPHPAQLVEGLQKSEHVHLPLGTALKMHKSLYCF